jgi:hypothetical protein
MQAARVERARTVHRLLRALFHRRRHDAGPMAAAPARVFNLNPCR